TISEQKAVRFVLSIAVRSHDLARGVDPVGIGMGRAGHVERGVAAIIEQEAVVPGSIVVPSHDLARVVYPVCKVTMDGFGRAWHIERGETVSWLGHHLPRNALEQAQGHQTAKITFHGRILSLDELITWCTPGINHFDSLSKCSGRAGHVRCC